MASQQNNISIEIYYNKGSPPSIKFMTHEEFENHHGDYMICSDCGIFVKEKNVLTYKKKFNLSFYEIKCLTCCRLKQLEVSSERLEELQYQRQTLVQQN